MRKITALISAILIVFSSTVSFAEQLQDDISGESQEVSETASCLLPEPVISQKKVTLLLNGEEPLTWSQPIFIGDSIFVPAIAFSKLVGIDTNLVDFCGSAATILTKDGNTAYFFNDTYYALINTVGQNLPYPCYNINGILYAPLDTVATLFELEYTVTDSEEHIVLDIISNINPNAKSYEEHVNSHKLKSDTDYLIWVSKANYSVRLFTLRKDGTWRFKEEFPCAIGKSYTPTCEGTYKYYEKIERWPYAKYYVGPVMRFNRGYAIHSTLMRYNGTAYDDRVEAKISAGCIRMHQPDIQYLWDNVPLYTTVYVTGE